MYDSLVAAGVLFQGGGRKGFVKNGDISFYVTIIHMEYRDYLETGPSRFKGWHHASFWPIVSPVYTLDRHFVRSCLLTVAKTLSAFALKSITLRSENQKHSRSYFDMYGQAQQP